MRHGLVVSVVVLVGLAIVGVALRQPALVAACAAVVIVVAIARSELRAAAAEVEPHVSPNAILVAIVCPDQAERLGQLASTLASKGRDVIVLAVNPKAAELPIAEAVVQITKAKQDLPPDLSLGLQRLVTALGKPVTFLTAAGSEPAAVTLEVARRLGIKELVVVRDDSASVEEQERLAAAAWSALPAPKRGVEVHMIEVGAGVEHRFLLGHGDVARATAAA